MVPWLYVRDVLARRYHVPPFEVDEWPNLEIELAMKIMDLEASCHPPAPATRER